MENQLEAARKGQLTGAVQQVARDEHVPAEKLRDLVAEGKVAILQNARHKNLTPKGVGKGLSIKVNANLGTSTERVDIALELEKLAVATEAGADAVMDLSTGGELDQIRKTIMAHATIPEGTVPI
jgi:phosphomethylpyrimidine synthase